MGWSQVRCYQGNCVGTCSPPHRPTFSASQHETRGANKWGRVMQHMQSLCRGVLRGDSLAPERVLASLFAGTEDIPRPLQGRGCAGEGLSLCLVPL